MTDAEAATDTEVAHKSIIEGPYDEPLDGSMSLHDLWYWIFTEGHRLTNWEIAEKAIRRRGVVDVPWFTALPEDKKFDCGFEWARKDADEAIRLAGISGRIRLRGISKQKPGRVRRIPRHYLRNAVLDLLGGQPMSDKEKFGPRQYGEIGQMRPNSRIHDITWTAVCIDKRDVREEWPFGEAPTVEAPSGELDTPETRRAKPVQKSPKNRSSGRSRKLRESAKNALREMFPNGVPRGDPNWTQEAITAAVIKQIGSVSLDTVKRAIKELRADQSNAQES